MLPLAITSTAGWIRRLGGRRWNRLHRVVYLTGILGPLHYWWLVKADVSRPLTYAAVVAGLLGARVYLNRERKQPIPPRAPVPPPRPPPPARWLGRRPRPARPSSRLPPLPL